MSKNCEDLMPLKDEFESDDSYIDVQHQTEQKKQETQPKQNILKKPIRRIIRNYRWKLRWIPIKNIIQGSQPIYIRKWAKVKHNNESEQIQVLNEKICIINTAQEIINMTEKQ